MLTDDSGGPRFVLGHQGDELRQKRRFRGGGLAQSGAGTNSEVVAASAASDLIIPG